MVVLFSRHGVVRARLRFAQILGRHLGRKNLFFLLSDSYKIRYGTRAPLPWAVALRMVSRRDYRPFGGILNPAQRNAFFRDEAGGEEEVGDGGGRREVVFGEPGNGF